MQLDINKDVNIAISYVEKASCYSKKLCNIDCKFDNFYSLNEIDSQNDYIAHFVHV